MLGWELPPHNSGGLGVACYHLCKALSKKPIDIEFILPYSAPFDEDFMTVTAAHPQSAEDVLITASAYESYQYLVPHGQEHLSGDIVWQQKMYEKSVARLVESREFDVIHAHDWLTFRAALRAKQQRNVPLILHVHSIERDRAGGNSGNPLVREIEEVGFMMADRIIAVSELTKQAIVEDYGIPADKIEVVHNSLDLATLPEADGANAYAYLERLRQQGYKIVVSVGRITVQKNLYNLLLAAREVIDRHPKTVFLFVGSGEQQRELIELAAKLRIAKNVIFAGFQRGKHWRDAFTVSDLFVMPSVSEPFGITALESVGFGTPALVSKQSGVTEVMQNLLKVDFWDVDEMANQITAAVRHDGLVSELQTNAHRELQNLSWDHAADKMHAIYEQHAGVPA